MMKENISKLDNKIVSLVFMIPCLFLVGFALYSVTTSPGLTELIKKRNLDENIHGVVDSLYLDVQNHNTTFAVLRDKKEIPINGSWDKAFYWGDLIKFSVISLPVAAVDFLSSAEFYGWELICNQYLSKEQ